MVAAYCIFTPPHLFTTWVSRECCRLYRKSIVKTMVNVGTFGIFVAGCSISFVYMFEGLLTSQHATASRPHHPTFKDDHSNATHFSCVFNVSPSKQSRISLQFIAEYHNLSANTICSTCTGSRVCIFQIKTDTVDVNLSHRKCDSLWFYFEGLTRKSWPCSC